MAPSGLEEGNKILLAAFCLLVFARTERPYTEEVEAESISYAVCKYFVSGPGLSTSSCVLAGVRARNWKELRASLETINKTSGTLISDIERHYKEICKERGLIPMQRRAGKPPR